MKHPPVSFGEVIDDRAGLARALGLRPVDLMPEVPVQVVSTGVPFLFVALKDAGAIDRAISSAERLGAFFEARESHSVFLFASVGPNRLYSRMFAPHILGIAEDAATGAASGPRFRSSASRGPGWAGRALSISASFTRTPRRRPGSRWAARWFPCSAVR